MEFIQNWAKGLVALAVLVGLAELLLPQDSLKQYVRMVLGLLVVVALIRPVVRELPGWKSWEPTLKAAAEGDLERTMEEGAAIRERGAAAAGRLLLENPDIKDLLNRVLPGNCVLRVERNAGKILVSVKPGTPEDAEAGVVRVLSGLGWEKNAIEVKR